MSIRLNTLVVAIAAVLSPLAAQAQSHDGFQQIGDTLIRVEQSGPSKTRAEVRADLAASQRIVAGHDGFQLIGDTLVRVAQPAAVGKTRAEVLAELAAWRKNPVHADGWAEAGGGDSLRYVGVVKPAAAPVVASGDLRLAAGEGYSMGMKAETAKQAEPKLNDLPVHLRFGRH